MLNKKFVDIIVNSCYLVFDKQVPGFKIIYKKEISTLFNEKLKEKKLKSKNIQNPKVFDVYSYAMFRVFYKRLRDKGKMNLILRFIGKKIYDEIKKKAKFTSNVKKDLVVIQKYFQKNKYYKSSKIVWEDKKSFKYLMNSPVIFNSAKELFHELGFAQHFSSRVIEAYFNEHKIKATEKNFNPFAHQKNKVVEYWEFK